MKDEGATKEERKKNGGARKYYFNPSQRPPPRVLDLSVTVFKGKETLGGMQTLPLLFKDMIFDKEFNDAWAIEEGK
jgi:hypothetical protein